MICMIKTSSNKVAFEFILSYKSINNVLFTLYTIGNMKM